MVLCPEIRSNPGDGLFPGQTVGCVVIEQRGNAQVVGGKGAVYLGILLTLKGALQGVGNVRLPIDSVKEAGQRFEELAVIVNQVGRKLNGDSHETVRQGLDLQAVKKGKRTAAHRESPSNLDVNSSLHNISHLTLYPGTGRGILSNVERERRARGEVLTAPTVAHTITRKSPVSVRSYGRIWFTEARSCNSGLHLYCAS
jgi:hypothetical protein